MPVTDRYDLAIEHLMNQFEQSDDFKSLLRVAFNRILDSDEVNYNIENETDTENATGVWLDILGRIVGVKRPAAEFDQDKIFTYGALAAADPLKGYSSLNILKDGDMEKTGLDDWGKLDDPVLTKETSGAQGGVRWLKVAYNGLPTYWATQSNLVTGNSYRVTGYGRGYSTSAPVVGAYHDGGSFTLWTGTSSPLWQYFDVAFGPADDNVIRFGSYGAVTGFVGFDEVALVALSGGVEDFDGGYYQSFEGLPALDGSFMSDTNFRALVKAKAGANFAIGTIPDIYTFVNTAFGFTPLVYNAGPRSVAVKIGSTISQNKKYLIEALGPRLAGVALGVIE